jgi:Domain of unknown function (DUF4417)
LSSQRPAVLKALANLGVELITSPNYSLFTDVPRHDNLYNVKRIGIAWHESVDSQMPCALHLNARTPRDYERLTQFIKQRAEVTDVAFEFKTGGAWHGRRAFHHHHLAEVGRQAGKPLRLLMVGGLPAIPSLAPAYAKLTFIDTTAFMKAIYRQRLVIGTEGKILGVTDPTEPGAPVDALLAHNIETMAAYVENLVNASRQAAPAGRSALTQENPETTLSVQAPPAVGRAGR